LNSLNNGAAEYKIFSSYSLHNITIQASGLKRGSLYIKMQKFLTKIGMGAEN
jgi:hypothetical protein